MLVISPTVAIPSHLQTHYHTNVVNGVIILTESSPETSPIPSKELIFDEINNDDNDNDKYVKKRNIKHFTNDDDDDDVVDDDDDRNSTRTHRRVLHKSHAHEDDVEEDMDFSRKRSYHSRRMAIPHLVQVCLYVTQDRMTEKMNQLVSIS